MTPSIVARPLPPISARAVHLCRAAANGNITKLEQRNINSANRDAGLRTSKSSVDNARTHLGNVKVSAARDGKITPAEQGNINAAQGNLNRLTAS
jgi:hypothetical protein